MDTPDRIEILGSMHDRLEDILVADDTSGNVDAAVGIEGAGLVARAY